MTVQDVVSEIQEKASQSSPIGHTFKFVFEDGVIYVDSTGEETIVTEEDGEADCAMHMKMKTFEKLKAGKLNPMTAVMFGKIKIKGDMGVAMKLQKFL